MRWLHSLASRQALAQLLGLALVAGVVGAAHLQAVRRSVRAEAARVGETAVAIFVEELAQEPGRLGSPDLQATVDRLTGKLVGVSRLRVMGADGRVVADSAPSASPSLHAPAPRAADDRIEIVRPIRGAYDPARRSNHLGSVSAEVDLGFADRRVQRAFLQGMAWLMVLIPAYWLVQFALLERSVPRRLRGTAGAAAAISAGRYGARTGIRGRDEIGQLGEAFDHMAARLEASHQRTQADMAERSRADARIRELNRELESSLSAIRSHNQGIALLNDMSKVLQASASVDEAMALIPRYVDNLLDAPEGGVYLLRPSRDQLELAAPVGRGATAARYFAPDQCWGLRLGKPHVSSVDSPLHCAHLGEARPGREVHCVPLQAQSDATGLLMLEFAAGARDDGERDARGLRVEALAEQLGIALANLRLRETLRQQSIKDPLTGLFNRRYLEETLQREIDRARRGDAPLAAIMLDVDHFKRFNDTFGHDAGDHVLAVLGRVLARHVRNSDIACRYGGEEFVLVLPGASQADAMQRAEQLRAAVSALDLDFMGQRIGNLSISLGVAALVAGMEQGGDLLKRADQLLFEAKAQGRNRAVGA